VNVPYDVVLPQVSVLGSTMAYREAGNPESFPIAADEKSAEVIALATKEARTDCWQAGSQSLAEQEPRYTSRYKSMGAGCQESTTRIASVSFLDGLASETRQRSASCVAARGYAINNCNSQ
jgi:hypothetical protein